jgi:hypothetical protein
LYIAGYERACIWKGQKNESGAKVCVVPVNRDFRSDGLGGDFCMGCADVVAAE